MSDAADSTVNYISAGGGNDHEVNGQLSNALDADLQQANAKSSAYNNRIKERHTQQQIDREERLRLIKERQNEERHKKLEELRQQALAAQKFREKTEEDRRRRIEDLRNRENDRRHQVEERKRMIMEAERDRREAILRRNMERDAKIESKRKIERNSIIAFGSSTPRMLDPTDSGNTYWGRRATSTMNVMTSSAVCPSSLTRRSSERELTNGNKKRATSAGGLLDRKIVDGEGKENNCGDITDGVSTTTATLTQHHQHQLQYRSAARRKTDLMPTLVPSSNYRETNGGSRLNSVYSSSSSRRSPGRAFSMTRLDQLSQPRIHFRKTNNDAGVGGGGGSVHKSGNKKTNTLSRTKKAADMSKSMTHLAQSATMAVATTNGDKTLSRLKRTSTSKSMVHLGPPPRMTRAERLRKMAREGNTSAATSAKRQSTSPTGSRSGETTPRPQSALSQDNGSGFAVPTRQRPRTVPPRTPRPKSFAGVTSNTDTVKQNCSGGKSPSSEIRTAVPKANVTKRNTFKVDTGRKTEKSKSSRSSSSTTPKDTPVQSPTVELSTEGSFSGSESGDRSQVGALTTKSEISVTVSDTTEQRSNQETNVDENIVEHKSGDSLFSKAIGDSTDFDMSGSMTSSQIRRITTEEEAKAALAERRRLAREQLEREAELEQQRLEAERLAEEERLRKEEEEQRKMEEEQLRLLEEAKKAEEERLLQAIEETKKREEEERHRKDKELKLKLEKEEADRKMKEEAERIRQETEKKLKKEGEDREARRKRVQQIMDRTREKNKTPASTPSKETNSSNETVDDKMNGVNKAMISSDSSNNALSENEQLLALQRSNANEIGSSEIINPKQNGVHCSLESRNVEDLLDLTDFDVIDTNMVPSETVSSQILDIPVTKDNFNSNNKDITDLLS